MDQSNSAALDATGRALCDLFEKYLTLARETGTDAASLSRTELDSCTDVSLLPYARRFDCAVKAIGRDARRETAAEEPMAAALRLIGAEPAQMQMGANVFAQAIALAMSSAEITPAGRNALVIGEGDEAETLASLLLSLGAKSAEIAPPERAVQFPHTELLVNATAVGAFPENGVSPVKLSDFSDCVGVVDFISDPLRTALVLEAQSRGIPAVGGLPISVGLAALATGRFSGPAPEAEIGRLVRRIEAARGNLILIGVSGCRAETEALAELTGREAVFLDDEIADAAEKPVSALFRDDGEAVYRFFERRAAARLGACKELIIAASSGIAADGRNSAALRQNGRVYYLTGLSASDATEQLERERDGACRALADAVVEQGGTPEKTARAVLQEYKTYFEM